MDFEDLPDLSNLAKLKPFERFVFNRHTGKLQIDGGAVIFAMLLDRALGDFVMRNLVAASIAASLEGGRLQVYYRDDRPYKSSIIALNPHVDKVWTAPGPAGMPMDVFDVAADAPVKVDNPKWYTDFAASPDLVLTPTMLDQRILRSLPVVARYQIPDNEVSVLNDGLLERGLDPDRWFCVVHYREPNFIARGANAFRDVDPVVAQEITRYIIEDLGGQVVRIGHPGMEKFPAMPGFIDLSGVENGLLLHCLAISRARFFFEVSSSGPSMLAIAFGVPLVRCNSVDLEAPLCENSIELPMHVISPDGRRVPQELALRKRLISTVSILNVLGRDGFRFQQNGIGELRAAARDIVNRTADCLGWRDVDNSSDRFDRSSLDWPPQRNMEKAIVEYPDEFSASMRVK